MSTISSTEHQSFSKVSELWEPYAALTQLRINSGSRQKYICVSIAKSPGELYMYAHFWPETYEVYV